MDESSLGRLVHGLAKAVAIAGGLVLIAVVVVVVLSVIGRTLIWAGLRPIAGDYEIVEAGVLFAIFAFMPWCHLVRGHAIVGILTDRLSPRANVLIELLMDVLMLAVAIFIVWRHWAGMMDKLSYQETTFILRMPIWWSYAASMIGAASFVIVAAYVVVRSAVAAASPNPQMPTSGMVE
jgi:TRAP-type C4-dicarboxylate transport system permease small subunit